MRHGLKGRLMAGAAILGLAAPAFAQDEGGPEGPTAAKDEIIVTSRFREESIQDIGVSVAGVSGDDMREQGLRDFNDVARTVAGVQNIQSRQNNNDIAIRGVFDSGAPAGRSTSSVYSVFLDDVSVAAPGSQRDYSSVDLDRIEIVRGPQPTLFGEGAVGGVIRYFTRDPDLDGDSFTGELSGQIEGIEDGAMAYSGENATSLILVPGKLGVRLSGFYRRDGGFIDNTAEDDVNDFDSFGGRVVLLAQPTDDLEVRVAAFLSRDDMGESTQVDPGSDPEDLTFSASPIAGEFADDFDLVSTRISYDFGAIEATSITGLYERRQDSSLFSASNTFGLAPFFASDTPGVVIDTTSYLTFATTQKQMSQEFRFVSDFGGPLNFTSGFYYRDKDIRTSAALECAGCIAVTTPATSNLVSEVSTTESKQYSGFLELTLALSDNFRLIGGARYVSDKIVANLIENQVINLVPRFDLGGNLIPWTESDPIDFASPRDILIGIGFGTEFEFKLNRFLPRGGIEIDLTDDILFYANAAVGARNGGVGQAIGALTNSGGNPALFFDNLTFDEDSVLTFEGGFKTSWLDGDLVANVGLFHSKFRDTQILVQLPASNITNGPDQRIIGMEIETAYIFNDHLSGFFNAAVMDTEFTDGFSTVLSPPAGQPAPFIDLMEGNAAMFAPKLSFSTGYAFAYPLNSSGLRFTSHGAFQYVGERFSSVQNYPSTRLDPLGILNLRVGLENDAFALNFFATNVLNDIEAISIDANSVAHFINANGVLDADPTSVSVNRPRTYGVSLSISY